MSSKPPYEMIGLDHVVIRCADQNAMARFYCDVIGGTVPGGARGWNHEAVRGDRRSTASSARASYPGPTRPRATRSRASSTSAGDGPVGDRFTVIPRTLRTN